MTQPPVLPPFVKGLAFPESPRWHDGALWFSDFHAWHVSVACMLGGAERKTLFVLTGRVLVTPAESLAERSGMIFAAGVDVPGASLP